MFGKPTNNNGTKWHLFLNHTCAYDINVPLDGNNIYLNQGFFIVKNIFSEINPNYFEY